MSARPNRVQRAVIALLIVAGVLAAGFLVYVALDRLSPANPALDPSPESVDETQSASRQEPATDPTDVQIGIRIGQRAPDFKLPSLDNEDVSLSDHLGSVVILDFWASWCGPCKLTMPGLEQLAQSMAPDVVLLGVSLDRKKVDASDYLSANNYDAIIALYGSYTLAYNLFQAYGNGGIPKTFVIDREGIIRYVGHPASLSRQVIEALI